MAYNPELDELVEELGEVHGTTMVAEIRRYDGGKNKLVLTRNIGGKKVKSARVLSLPISDALDLSTWFAENYNELRQYA